MNALSTKKEKRKKYPRYLKTRDRRLTIRRYFDVLQNIDFIYLSKFTDLRIGLNLIRDCHNRMINRFQAKTNTIDLLSEKEVYLRRDNSSFFGPQG